MVSDPRVAFFSFIGSGEVGWGLRTRLAPGARCSLEHGGVAPVIVADDADLDACVAAAGEGGFYHAGQVCVSVQRVFAQRRRPAAGRAAGRGGRPAEGRRPDAARDRGRPADPRRRKSSGSDEWVRGGGRRRGAICSCGGRPLAPHLLRPHGPAGPAGRLPRHDPRGLRPGGLRLAVRRRWTTRWPGPTRLPYAFQAAVFTRDLDAALRAAAAWTPRP